MFAIGFDLLLHQTRASHPNGMSQTYADIGAVLNRYGFIRAFKLEHWSDFTDFMKT